MLIIYLCITDHSGHKHDKPDDQWSKVLHNKGLHINSLLVYIRFNSCCSYTFIIIDPKYYEQKIEHECVQVSFIYLIEELTN